MLTGLSRNSVWNADECERFLRDYRAPLRVAANTASGFPLVCSLWFAYRDGGLHCATQRDAKIVQWLRADPRAGFELAPNEPPYFGVRGRARATILEDGAQEELAGLVDRYLEARDAPLARWLLDRADDEVVIRLEIEWITSWDFRGRMAPRADASPAGFGLG